MRRGAGCFGGACALLLVWAAEAHTEGNLVTNPGFEEGLKGWEIELGGAWGERTDRSRVVRVSSDARTGRKALTVDTTVLNPEAKIAGSFTTRRNPSYPNSEVVPNYTVRVSQVVRGIKPDHWYLAKLHIRSPGIAIDEGIQYIADMRPKPFGWGNWRKVSRWKHVGVGAGRLLLPQAPTADGRYHEYVVLKETYAGTNGFAIGLDIRAPWTGEIIVDDIELVELDPDRDMTKMQKLLAMRGTKPLEKVRELHRETTLVKDGKATSAILIPTHVAYRSLGQKIAARIRELTGATVPVTTELERVPPGFSIVAVGNMMNNDLVARLHFNRYVHADARDPGPGGYVIWTVAEPYGLARGQNVIVVAGSDVAGERAAADAFCRMLAARGGTIALPFLHTVSPRRTIGPEERNVPRKRYGFGGYFNGFTKWYLPLWLKTGDLEVGRLARTELMRLVDQYLSNPYCQVAWESYEVGWAWDALEELPVFSKEDRLKISNVLLAYLHMRAQAGTSNWHTSRLQPNPAWNHQAKGLAAAYGTGRYFDRFHGGEDARYAYYVKTAAAAFKQQARSFKPQENSENYWAITINFAMSYYVGEWDKTFFANGALMRAAEYFATTANSKGGIAGFGDAYYVYTGDGGGGKAYWDFCAPFAFWHYRDGRILWWLRHVKPDYKNPYHQDVVPVEWKELIGVKRTPLEKDLYDPDTHLALWGSGGEGTWGPVGDVKYEETFDKIAFRENWDKRGQYLLLEGLCRGIHSGYGTNQICKVSILGEDLLIGSTYKGNDPRTNCNVVILKGVRDIGDPGVQKRNRWGWPWPQVMFSYPSYAACEATADLPRSGFSRSMVRDYQGADWYRNIFWLKGKYFALIDEITARKAGTYYIESNMSTCPTPTVRWVRFTPRSFSLLPDDGGFEIAYQDGDGTKHYMLTTGASTMRTETRKAQDITKVIVRQVRKGVRLGAGVPITFVNLLYGDRQGDRQSYQLRRLGPTEGLILQNGEPVAYFGTDQGDQTKALLPIEARMFLLTGEMLAIVDGTSAGRFHRSPRPVSREVNVPPGTARDILTRLAGVAGM